MMLPSGVKVHIAAGVTDMRKGMDGLAMLVQGVLREDPFSGHLFAFRDCKANRNTIVFRGSKAGLMNFVFWDGTGLALLTKRPEHGVFVWPPMSSRDRRFPWHRKNSTSP